MSFGHDFIATRYTRVPAGTTAQLIAGGESIRVSGIVVVGTANGTVNVFESDSTTSITNLTILANTTFEQRTDFLAPNGVAITTPAGVDCTVFHSNASA